MSRRRTYTIIVVVGVLTAALDLLMHLIPESPGAKPWLEHQSWYSAKILIFAVACLVLAIVAVELWRHRSTDDSERVTESSRGSLGGPTLRLQLLDKVQRERVDPRLRQGLREAIRVDLGLTETPNAVQPKLRAYVMSESAAAGRERPIEGLIQNVFKDAAGGRLLILGEPGTGKTNLLLELADSLISDAKRNETLPIPVVFNLPRWTLGKRALALDKWLIHDLQAEYGLSHATANELITRNRILPLLDGLDEVSEPRRAGCVDAINAFQQSRDLSSLVVCCRTEKYASLPKLDLGTAVRVEKLARADIERQIAVSRLKHVRQALESDPQLWQIIDTPLWLHVLYGASIVNAPKGGENQNPRDRLYARFVDYALGREEDGSARKRTAREPLLRWLGWLAAEMQSRDQSQFAFEDLDWFWLPSKSAQIGAISVGILFVVLVSGLSVLLLGGTGFGLSGWLSSAMLVGGIVLLGLRTVPFYAEHEAATEELYFSWQACKDAWGAERLKLCLALVGVLLVGLGFGQVGGLLAGQLFALGVGLASVLMYAMVFGLVPRSVSEYSAPNRATQRSLVYALIIILSSGILGAVLRVTLALLGRVLFSGEAMRAGTGLVEILRLLFPIMFLAVGWMVALANGGSFVLRHYSTRLFLYWRRLAPLRYVRFLNEATERLFLIRHGGSYEFLHLTFRDYMARARGPQDLPREAN